MEAFGSVKMHGTTVFIFFGLMILSGQVFALLEECKLHDSINNLLIRDDAMDVSIGGVGSVPLIFSNLHEGWSKLSQTAGGLATVSSVTYFLITI